MLNVDGWTDGWTNVRTDKWTETCTPICLPAKAGGTKRGQELLPFSLKNGLVPPKLGLNYMYKVLCLLPKLCLQNAIYRICE